MGGSFPPGFIETVRDAADIVRVIADYVPLKQAGVRFKGLCPFHQEKTPSFSVNSQNQLFYCFGCQTGGDVFKFVQLYEKLTFPEAVEQIAGRFSIPMPVKSPQAARAEDERERLLRMNETAAEFYRARLADDSGAACRAYLASRGIDDATAERLGLGYAPDAWEALRTHLQARRFTPVEMVRGGLVVERPSGSGHYDRFRNRLIFPIRDLRGRTVAFGGRALVDDEVKYINSPETPAYTKGDQLYGLDLARDTIRREGFAVVVEGYLDLAALVQAGFDNVVAALGTAFTPAQARLLARHTERVLISFDGDSAGAKATARSVDLLLEKGLDVRVVDLPAGMDPDDHVRQEGRDAFDALLREAPGYLAYLVRREARVRDLNRTDEKIAALNEVLPHIARLEHAVERSAWAGRLADALGIEDDLVLQELRTVLKTAQTRIRQRPASSSSRLRPAEARLVHLLLVSDEQRRVLAARGDLSDLEGTSVAPIVETILRMEREGRAIDPPSVLEALASEELRGLLTRIAFAGEPDEGPGVEDCLWTFHRERLEREQRETVRRIGALQEREGAATQDLPTNSEVDQWLMQMQDLARKRDALHGNDRTS